MIRPRVLTQAEVSVEGEIVSTAVTMGSNNEVVIQPHTIVVDTENNLSVAGASLLESESLDGYTEISLPGSVASYVTTVHAQNIDLPQSMYYLESKANGRWILGRYEHIHFQTYSLTILSRDATNR